MKTGTLAVATAIVLTAALSACGSHAQESASRRNPTRRAARTNDSKSVRAMASSK